MARGRSASGTSWRSERNDEHHRGGRSQRQLRVGEAVRHALSEVLMRAELRDPVLVGLSITVSEVRISPDLRAATCFVLPLGGQEADAVCEALARAAPWLAAQVSRHVRLKFTPRLSFKIDRSFDTAQRMNELLQRKDVAGDLAAENEAAEGGAAAEDRDDGA